MGRKPVGLCLAVAALLVCELAALLCYSQVQSGYMTALQEKNVDAFYRGLWRVGGVILFISPVIALHEYTSGVMRMHWRSSLTRRLARSYLGASDNGDRGKNLFYRLTLTGEIDNPDQRICQDVSEFVDTAFRLVEDTVRTFLSILGFAGVLYSISPTICAGVIIYAVLGTVIATKGFGPFLAYFKLERVKQEAGLRYGLIRVRENAESIAFFKGGQAEWSNFSDLFAALMHTMYRSLIVTAGFSMFNRTFHWATFAVAPLLVGPAYLRGEVQFGVISQASMAFNTILGALTLIMDRLESLSDVAVRVRRLEALLLALQRGEDDMETMRQLDDSCIVSREISSEPAVLRLSEVTLKTPPRADVYQQTLCQRLSLELKSGRSLLIVGDSGIGKSSLLRAIAGLWSDGRGVIELCSSEAFFMPQRPYMFLGTLRDQLLYPNVKGIATDAEIEDALRRVNLGDLLEHHSLSDTKEWASLLSLGQQQRINFARVLLRPSVTVALIDEGTSACDAGNEALLYGLLKQRLRSFVSVGHRPALQAFHSDVLWLQKPEVNPSSSASGPTQFSFLSMAEFRQACPPT